MAPRVEDLPDEEATEQESFGDAEPFDEELDVPSRRGRTALAVCLVVALVAAAFVGVLGTRESAKNRRADTPLRGLPAPALAGRTLDGGDFDIADHRGSWVVVNFFATWCVPCVEEHPELVDLHEAHRRLEDVVVVSVLYDDDPDTAADFFERHGGTWPVVLDGDGAIAVGYGVTGVPETYLVQPDGLVFDRIVGGVTQDGLEAYMAEAEAALGEPGAGAGDGSGTADRTGRGEGEEQP